MLKQYVVPQRNARVHVRVSPRGSAPDPEVFEVLRGRLGPMKKVARSLRSHRELILNWFRARGTISAGLVEGFNGKAKPTTRKALGFRTKQGIEIALYHTPGNLPEPEFTHGFC